MVGSQRNVIYINGHAWRDVTHETTADRTYSRRQVEKIGGDPRRVHEIQYDSSND